MRTITTILFLLACTVLSAQVQDKQVPLAKGTWVVGATGNINFGGYWDKYTQNNTKKQFKNSVGKFSFMIDSGYFLQDRLALGLQIQRDGSAQSWEYDYTNNSSVDGEETVESFYYAGPWVRYYLPFAQNRWAFYPEFSVGYASFNQEDRTRWVTNEDEVDTKNADGLAFNIGGGFAYYLTDNLTLDICLRYHGGQLNGDWEDKSYPTADATELTTYKSDYELTLNRYNIMFGFQIYLF